MRQADNAAYWDKRSEIYDAKIMEIYKEANKRIVENTRKYLEGAAQALDIGCGPGGITMELQRAAEAIQITAIDTSLAMLEQAEKKAQQAGLGQIRFLLGDMFAETLEPGSFDIVTAFNVLLYLPDQELAMRRIKELLKPGGYLVAAADCLCRSLTREALRKWIFSRTGRMPYVKFYSPTSLKKLLRRHGFEILETEVLFMRPVNYFIGAKKIN